jgi:hypothetical protein
MAEGDNYIYSEPKSRRLREVSQIHQQLSRLKPRRWGSWRIPGGGVKKFFFFSFSSGSSARSGTNEKKLTPNVARED